MFKKMVLAVMLVGGFVMTFPFVWHLFLEWRYKEMIHDVDSAPAAGVVIVFGAGLRGDGFPSDMLRDRLDVAVALYKQGKAQKLLVSGDNRFENYNEPGAMMAYAVRQGVALEDIQPDYGGRRTYDTCYRARHIFQVEKALLVTQKFHLPRALFTCSQLGVKVVGVSADLQPYRRIRWFTIREVGAALQSLADAVQQKPAPVMGDPIPLED